MQDPTDKTLFYCSTYVHIGDGKNTPFWDARWLHGTAPKELAPSLYNLTRFKTRNVFTELQSHNWIKSLPDITTPRLLEEYIMLYMALSTITLTDHSDRIVWKWAANGLYSAASAYECQFKGAITYFPATNVWKANTDPKCRFFAWLILHNRAQTADILAKKNWPHNPSCSLAFACQRQLNTYSLNVIS
jgi:hypothetical protein